MKRGDTLDERVLEEIEHGAVALAKLAGAAIELALGRELAVRYKTSAGDEKSLRDPVTDADEEIELLLRSHLGERFPDHDILGEEREESLSRGSDWVWAIDPIDGTANFVNGFPLFACSIGVLFRGTPVVAAMWCASTHALRAGVYHAHAGGPLCFESAKLARRANATVKRRLAGVPGRAALGTGELPWEARTTGSAAIECAFVAAGLLEVARFRGPHAWDVAAGILLVQAAGGEVREETPNGWRPMTRFEPAGTVTELRRWQRGLVLGTAEAVARVAR